MTITPVESLKAPLDVNSKVADLSATGGTSPYSYELKDNTQDNAEFKVSGATVQVNTRIEEGATKNITVIATDSKGKTKEETAEIIIAGAGV